VARRLQALDEGIPPTSSGSRRTGLLVADLWPTAHLINFDFNQLGPPTPRPATRLRCSRACLQGGNLCRPDATPVRYRCSTAPQRSGSVGIPATILVTARAWSHAGRAAAYRSPSSQDCAVAGALPSNPASRTVPQNTENTMGFCNMRASQVSATAISRTAYQRTSTERPDQITSGGGTPRCVASPSLGVGPGTRVSGRRQGARHARACRRPRAAARTRITGIRVRL